TARSDYRINFVTGQLRAAYEADFGSFVVIPSFDAAVTYMDRDSVTETGGNIANLGIAGSDRTQVALSPAIELNRTVAYDADTTLRLIAKAGVTYLPDNDGSLRAEFLDAGGALGSFSTVVGTDDLYADFEAGVEILRKDSASFVFGYQGATSDNTSQHSLWAKAVIRF
ncbi:MAG: autotransporter outer membrane beta-barrel domain-containing protein, partial [Pseudomonadota bacterium]